MAGERDAFKTTLQGVFGVSLRFTHRVAAKGGVAVALVKYSSDHRYLGIAPLVFAGRPRTHLESGLAKNLAAWPAFISHTLCAMAITHENVAFGGWDNNLKISNGAADLLITLDVGPRVLHFSPTGGNNVFKVFVDQLGGTGEEGWQIRGGHRLWLAPEGFPFSYFPDNDSVDHELYPNGGATLTSTDEMPQGFTKQIDITLDPVRPRVRLAHRLINVVDDTQEVAAWMLSVMAPGGVAIMPQPEAKNHPGLGPGDFTPNRNLVLWPFTDLSDNRYHLGKRFFTLSQDANRGATKLGLNCHLPWVGYWNEGTLFVKKLSVDAGASYPDRNSAFEVFTNEEMLEVETLGPLTTLGPGKVLEAVEEWELFTDIPEFDAHDDASIARALQTTGLV